MRDAPQHITPVRRYARESRAQSPTVESVLEMEIDEIKRCAWPWAACTALGHRGGVGAGPGPKGGPWRWRAGGRASTGACGSAYEPSFRARARRRSGSRSRPGGMAERSAGAAPRPGGRVGSHAHAAPLRRVGVWPGQPRSRTWTGIWHACGRTVWRIAHRGLARGVNCVGRGRRWPLPFGVGRVTSCRRHSRPPARSPAFGPFTDTVRPPSACPSLPRRRPSRLPRSRSPAPGPSGAGWP